MPKVLLITYHYPPRHSAGSVRPAGLAKHLMKFGWDVVVLTPQLPAGPRPPAKVVETEYQDVIAYWKSHLGMDPKRPIHQQLNLMEGSRPNSAPLHTKLIETLRCLVAYPDEYRGWIPYAVQELQRLKRTEEIDVILSTSPPVSCHLIAAKAREILACPWVADFRDLWSQQTLWGVHRLFQRRHQRLERKTLKTADALVTVSDPWAERLRVSYPAKPVHTITNGFDPDDFRFPIVNLTPYFSLTHAGYLYEGQRDPTLLFEVVGELMDEGAIAKNDFRIRFYGPPEAWLASLVRRYRLEEIVEVCGTVPREEALRHEAESQMLLLLGWSDPREIGQHTGKLFEYFGTGRPILAVNGSRGVLTEILAETKAGVHVLNKEQLRRTLISAYQDFKRSGAVPYLGDARAIGRYTHTEMARRFSKVLGATMEQSRTKPVSRTRREAWNAQDVSLQTPV